jgi:Cdc6-like AAA superfamily ATPase
MTLDTATHRQLLTGLDLGASVAEHDQLLQAARIETPTFAELVQDRIDLVRGTKGSGKTALFRIFTDALRDMMKERHVIIVPGIENVRDPIFMKYRSQLAQLDEVSFENFWRMYFICVINNHILFDEQLADSPFRQAKKELAEYKDTCLQYGYPTPRGFTPQTLVSWVLRALPKPRVKRVEVGVELTDSSSPHAKLTIERDPEAARGDDDRPEEREAPVAIHEVHQKLLAVLQKTDTRIWVMLDRLDEIFARRSEIERTALRALFRTVTSFASKSLRLKIFVRDDVFESVTEAPGGFVNLTHLLSRTSATLTWNKAQLLHLLVKRIFANNLIRTQFGIQYEALDGDSAYREEAFYKIFPDRINAGKRQSSTFDWLMKHCEDGNGVVTPRDLIELITSAIRDQRETLSRQTGGHTSLLSAASIRAGYARMCEQKKISYLKAEFPHFWTDIEKFEGGKSEHTERSLERLLGVRSAEKIKNLQAIGFLRKNPRSKTYAVPHVYRLCLGIRQGREAEG